MPPPPAGRHCRPAQGTRVLLVGVGEGGLGRDQEGVVDRGVGGRIAEVQCGQVVQRQTGVQRGRHHVDPLGRTFPAHELSAQQPAACLVHEPDVQGRGPGVVLRPAAAHHVGGSGVEPGCVGLGQRQPGPCDLQVEHLDHGRADDAAEARVATGGHRAGDPPGPVGGRPQRHERRTAQYPVERGDAVARGPDPGEARAHPVVHQQRAARPGACTCRRGHGGLGPYARAHDDGVGVLFGEFGFAEPQRHVLPHVLLDERRNRFVEVGQHPVEPLGHRHLRSAGVQRLRHLQPDVAGADDECAPHLARVEQRPQRDRVLHRPDRERRPGFVGTPAGAPPAATTTDDHSRCSTRPSWTNRTVRRSRSRPVTSACRRRSSRRRSRKNSGGYETRSSGRSTSPDR